MTKPNFVVITHPKSETLANCLSKQDKTFLSQVNKYLAGENRVTSIWKALHERFSWFFIKPYNYVYFDISEQWLITMQVKDLITKLSTTLQWSLNVVNQVERSFTYIRKQ